MLAPISLAAAIFLSFGAAALASWALLELLLRVAKTRGHEVNVQRHTHRENTEVPDVPQSQLLPRTAAPAEPPPSGPEIGSVT